MAFLVFIVAPAIVLTITGYIIGRSSSNKEEYKRGYINAINDLYNKSVPEYILDKCDNGEVRWRENHERKTYAELQEGD